jgi:hypothetical protein
MYIKIKSISSYLTSQILSDFDSFLQRKGYLSMKTMWRADLFWTRTNDQGYLRVVQEFIRHLERRQTAALERASQLLNELDGQRLLLWFDLLHGRVM